METHGQMVERTDSFHREVDEDIRRDQLLRLWQSYGIYVSAGIAALFLGVIAYQWSESRRVAREEQVGASFEAATRLAAENKPDEALAAFSAIAKDATAGYQAVARLRVAATHAKAGRVAEALAGYEALGKDSGADELLRDFATLQAAMLRLDQADWTEMKNRLTPLLDDSKPWHAPAREVLGLAAYKAGQTDEATKLFEQILGDKASTSGLVRRAQEMLAVLTDAAAAKAAATAAPVPAAAAGDKPATTKTEPAKQPEPADKKR